MPDLPPLIRRYAERVVGAVPAAGRGRMRDRTMAVLRAGAWVAALSLVTGCGHHSALSRTQAQSLAARGAALVAGEDQRACRRRVRVTAVGCHTATGGWVCDFSLSDGTRGRLHEPPGRASSHPEVTVVC